jgi:ubiquinone/menaquinone biosynthesis C-methylase UbiE
MAEEEKKLFDWGHEDWVKKLTKQAEESREYRHKLYNKVGLRDKKKILDVGCGTGAVTFDMARSTNGHIIGIDIDPEKLEEARKLLAPVTNIELMEGDAQDLPFEDETFDLVVFTIVLMYIPDPQKAVNEMARVTRKGGHVLAVMEPDNAGTIDYPPSPTTPLLQKAMLELNADLECGRKLKFYFNTAGLRTESGIETETDYILMKDDAKRTEMLRNQLWIYEKVLRADGWSEEDIEKYTKDLVERTAKGLTFHFQPVMYAIGEKV